MVSIQVKALRVALGRREVVRDVDAEFAAGTLTGIIGPNGAGKSTLARAMLALAPYRGRVLIDGTEAAAMRRPDLARKVAYLPQGQTVHWPVAVERLVGLGRLPHLAPMAEMTPADAAAVESAMLRTDVLALRERIANELSGGERARVLLARALAAEAAALIVDEPLASLDPGHQIDVMELLRAEASAGGLVVAVLHDLTMAARYCDRLLLIDNGRVVACGVPAEVLTPGNLCSVYGIDAHVEDGADGPTVAISGRSAPLPTKPGGDALIAR